MVLRLGMVVGAGLLVAAGCADGGRGPAHPLASAAADEVHALPSMGGQYPTLEEVPPEQRVATVYSSNQRVRWDGNMASGYASMEYFGNRGEHEMEMQILHGYSTVATARMPPRIVSDYMPWRRVMGTPLEYALPESCGQTANLSVVHRAKTIVLYNFTITTIGRDEVQGQASMAQPDCSPPPTGCAPKDSDSMTGILPVDPNREVSPDNFAYDPYDPGSEQTVSCGGGGGTGEGSGGSMGGSFAATCGSLGGTLHYDYGCLEAYDPETQKWNQVWCGTIAVCET